MLIRVSRREEDGRQSAFWSCKVTFAREITADVLKQKVLFTLIHLRHLVPSVACKIVPSPGGFQFEYRTPTGLDDALNWTEQVVFFAEEGTTFMENYGRVAPHRWWKASEGRYTYEIHVFDSPEVLHLQYPQIPSHDTFVSMGGISHVSRCW